MTYTDIIKADKDTTMVDSEGFRDWYEVVKRGPRPPDFDGPADVYLSCPECMKANEVLRNLVAEGLDPEKTLREQKRLEIIKGGPNRLRDIRVALAHHLRKLERNVMDRTGKSQKETLEERLMRQAMGGLKQKGDDL